MVYIYTDKHIHAGCALGMGLLLLLRLGATLARCIAICATLAECIAAWPLRQVQVPVKIYVLPTRICSSTALWLFCHRLRPVQVRPSEIVTARPKVGPCKNMVDMAMTARLHVMKLTTGIGVLRYHWNRSSPIGTIDAAWDCQMSHALRVKCILVEVRLFTYHSTE